MLFTTLGEVVVITKDVIKVIRRSESFAVLSAIICSVVLAPRK